MPTTTAVKNTTSKQSMLQQAMFANALFSFVSGSLFVLAQDFLKRHIPLADLIWTVMGLGLILFSAQLVLMVKNDHWAEKLIGSVILSDIIWIVISFATLLYFRTQISPLGRSLIIAIDVIVAVLALLQYIGIARIQNKNRNK